MAIKVYKPTSPGRRKMSTIDYSGLSKERPWKKLSSGKKRISGRDGRGSISIRHRGGGHKRLHRDIDMDRSDKLEISAKVETIEYDPNRTAFISRVCYEDGERRYILAPDSLRVGDKVVSGIKTKVKPGNRMQIGNIPVGQTIHAVESFRGKGAVFARSAGTVAVLTSLDSEHAQVRMPSGEIRFVPKECYATIGTVSNTDHGIMRVGKAGRKRWLGRRPQVRGKVMNPNDHPHGGGEARNSIGMKHPKTPWGRPALGVRTRRNKSTDRWIAKSRHLLKKKK